MRSRAPATLLTVLLMTAGAGDLSAQTDVEVRARAAGLTLGGRVQTQLRVSSVGDTPAEVFFRRARLRVDVRVDDFLDGRVNPDFTGGTATLQDAWVRMSFSPSFRLSLGQFKRAFSVFELSSSTDLPVIERDGRIAGLDVCPGVGGVCTFSRLTGGLAFDGRDQGIRMEGRIGGGLSYLATVTNGEGANAGDVNDAKSVSGRLEYDAGRLAVGAFAGLHDSEVFVDDGGRGHAHDHAAGVDLEIGTWRDGLHLLGAVAIGENWKAGRDSDFRTVQLLGSYYVPTGDETYGGMEPLLRLAWTDPDTGIADNAAWLLTPGLMLYFTGKNGVSANVDAYIPSGDGDTELSFKLQSYLYF